jgi:hypothetical protein
LPTLNTSLAQIIDETAPCSLLLVGPEMNQRWSEFELTDSPAIERIETWDGAGIPPGEAPFDLVLVGGVLERLDRHRGRRLLASLRDRHARTLIVQLPCTARSPWSMADMLGFGFVEQGTFPEPDGNVDLYRFSLNDYKKTPDWLNARHWAHPHRWKP